MSQKLAKIGQNIEKRPETFTVSRIFFNIAKGFKNGVNK